MSGDRYELAGQAMRAALLNHGFSDVTVECSNVAGSPYRYVYVWFTPDRHDGLHALVSEASEFAGADATHYLVGMYDSERDFAEERHAPPVDVATLGELGGAVTSLYLDIPEEDNE